MKNNEQWKWNNVNNNKKNGVMNKNENNGEEMSKKIMSIEIIMK